MDGDIIACGVAGSPFHVTASVSRLVPAGAALHSNVPALLAELDDVQLARKAAGQTIDLGRDAGVPPWFFTVNSSLSSEPGAVPSIVSVDVADSVLKLGLESPGGRYKGMFVIDLRLVRVLDSKVEGESPLPRFSDLLRREQAR